MSEHGFLLPGQPATGGSALPTGPIADLSYRNYDGPLRSHPFRWWIIARMILRSSVRKWWFWLLTAFAVLPYVIPAFQLYMRSRTPPEAMAFFTPPPWGSYFYDAYSGSLFWLFLLALLVGSSSIAGDHRTNALQIYFSKPITKLDYLAGKWAGLFILLTAVALVPSLVLYLFTLASFQRAILAEEPTLWARVLWMAALPGFLHSSLILGFSAWSRRPLLTGGLYAGLYTGMGVVVSIVSLIVFLSGHPKISNTVAHVSLPGILRGIGQHVYNSTPTFFGMQIPGRNGQPAEKPDLLPVALTGAGLCAAGLAAARFRIRAVEVVRG